MVLLMGRNLRTRLYILKPNIRKRVKESSKAKSCELGIGQTVMARNCRTKEKWVPGVITAHPGPSSYEVSVAPNTVWRRHIDQLKETAVTPNITKEHCTPQLDPAAVLVGIPPATSSIRSVEEPQPPLASSIEEVPTINREEISSSNNSPSNEIRISCSATPPPRRYPLRLRKPPEKLNL